MKTKISLSIIGAFNVLMSLVMALTVKNLLPKMLNLKFQKKPGFKKMNFRRLQQEK